MFFLFFCSKVKKFEDKLGKDQDWRSKSDGKAHFTFSYVTEEQCRNENCERRNIPFSITFARKIFDVEKWENFG